MENSLLKNSNYQKRALLQSVRSYLENEEKTVSITSKRSQPPKSVEDSPPEKKQEIDSRGFGMNFRGLFNQSRNSEEVAPILKKRKHRSSPSVPEENHIQQTKPVEKSLKYDKLSISRGSHRPFISQPHIIATSTKQSHIVPSTSSDLESSNCNSLYHGSAGFTSGKWRERMQSAILSPPTTTFPSPSPYLDSNSASLQSGSSLQSIPESQHLMPSPSTIIVDRELGVSKTATMATESTPPVELRSISRRNSIPSTSEVSLNFIKKDLKGKGSCKFKSGGLKARNLKSRRFQQGRESKEFEGKTNGNSENTSEQRKPLGLSVFGLDPFHLYLENSNRNSRSRPRNQQEDRSSSSEIAPPLCPGHQMAAKLLVVKKSGVNKGKKFYTCSYPFDQRCKFFLWEEDNPNIFLSSSSSTTTVTSSSSSCLKRDGLLEGENCDGYLNSLLSQYRVRLLDYDLFELKLEVGRINQVLKCELNEFRVPKNGKKEVLVNELLIGVRKLFTKSEALDLQTSQNNRDIDDSEEQPFNKTKKHSPSEGSGDSEDSEGSVISLSDDEELEVEHPTSRVQKEVGSSDFLISQALRRSFGLSSLKSGQEWAIRRVLANQRSLLVLPTGAGKSLTFLLPSLLTCPRDGITIIISPLVALMRDQMRKLPFNLPAACLSGEVTASEAAKICRDMKNGYLRIIFISPEKFCSSSFIRMIKSLHNQTNSKPCSELCDDLSTEITGPGVGLLCIDEAHCLSQWSFNFRPSFLRIQREIKRIQPKSVLALTATAPSRVQRDIQRALDIPCDGNFLLPPNRPNLELSTQYVNDEEQKRAVILETLNRLSEPKKKTRCSTIIYVWRRDEAESLSEFLHIQGISAKAYHAGMPTSQRSKIQHLFHRGILDVVVATIAFGMGIDKPNIRLIIHHSMPKDIESYLQEIGRAGRDGLPSRCLLLLSIDDFLKHHSFSYSPTLSIYQILFLLQRIFIPLPTRNFLIEGKIALDLDEINQQLDISVSMTETIVCYLEQDPYSHLTTEESRYDHVVGKFKISPNSNETNQLIKAILLMNKCSKANETSCCDFEFSLMKVANHLRLTPEEVSSQLFQMQNRGVLVYTLSRKCLYLDIAASPTLQSLSEFHFWLKNLAKSIFEELNSKLLASANRVQDVWSFGRIISKNSEDNSTQDLARDFLLKYMTEDGQEELFTSSSSSNLSFPFVHSPSLQFHGSWESNSDLQKCKRQIEILSKDPSILDLVQRIQQASLENGRGRDRRENGDCHGGEEDEDEVIRQDLKAVIIAKVLHGVQTSHIRSSDWDHRAQWNSCRMISFPTILSLCVAHQSHHE